MSIKEFYKNNSEIINIIGFLIGIGGLITLAFIFKIINSIYNLINEDLILSGLVFVLFNCLIVYYLIFRLNKKINTSILDENEIISDEETIFLESIEYAELMKETKAEVVKYIHPTWEETDEYYSYLKEAKWIAQSNRVTDDEAIYGGHYLFARVFHIPMPLKKIVSADLFFVVDDFCTVSINKSKICEREPGIVKIYRKNLKDKLVHGKNEIKFIIENNNFSKLFPIETNPAFYNSGEKYKHNPYGLRYRIVIKYKR